MTSLPANPIPSTSSFDPPNKPSSKNVPQLSDVAATLLPGLQHARSLIDVAVQVLSHFANARAVPLSDAQAAAKIRRLLANFGHPAERN
jgi:hypothetical protein